MSAHHQVPLQQERAMTALLKTMIEAARDPVRVRVTSDDHEDELIAFDFRPLIPDLVLLSSDAL